MLRSTRLCASAALALLVAVSAGSAAAQPPVYEPSFLGAVPTIAGMNSFGQVIGQVSLGGDLRGCVATTAGLTVLPLPEGFRSSAANDINEAGAIAGNVGTSYSPEFGSQAALWTPDGQGRYGVELLGVLPGHSASAATALNDVGDVVGYSSNGTFRWPVAFLGSGAVQDLSPTGIFDPRDVNDQRVVVDGSFTAKRLDLDTMVVEDLGVPTGLPSRYLATSAAVINERGQVAGTAILTTSTSCDRQAARYTDGIGWQILSQCGVYNGAVDMNDLGDVVMQLNVAPWVRFEGLGTYRIEDLIAAPVGHWYVQNVFGMAIDNTRRLAVIANNPATAESGLLLLTPTVVCQRDLGFAGPGNASLQVCGGDLTAGTTATAQLNGAAPRQVAALIAGTAAQPLALLGGTLVPAPPIALLVLSTDGAGAATVAGIPGGIGPAFVYMQVAYLDPGLPAGVGLSNAVEVAFQR